MGIGQKRNVLLVPQSQQGMYNFKYEVARDLNIQPPQGDYWGEVPARDCGAVGGHMVRRMIQLAEQQLAGSGTSGFTGGTTGGMTSGTTGFTGTTGIGTTTGFTGTTSTGSRGGNQNPSTTPRSQGTNRTSR